MNDAEVFDDVNENGYWDAGESFEDYDNNGLCGVYNGADDDGDGYCDGEICDDINDNGCDPNDQPYYYIIDDGMCNCPERYYDDIICNNQHDNGEPLTDENGNGIWDGTESFIDINGDSTWDESISETIIDTTIYRNPIPENIDDFSVIDGFRLKFNNIYDIGFNNEDSYWNNDSLWTFNITWFSLGNVLGAKLPYDYRVIFSDSAYYSSTDLCINYFPETSDCIPNSFYESREVNFNVQRRINYTDNSETDWENIPFGFIDVVNTNSFGADGYFNAWGQRESDWIVFLDHIDNEGDPFPTWGFYLNLHANDEELIYNQPRTGDTAYVFTEKPFLGHDIFEFTTTASRIDPVKANQDRWESNIKVVPNPYFGASAFEQKNTFSSGRGPREIQFRNLPAVCTIRIYNIAGELVREIHHDHSGSIEDGSESWDLLSKDNLSVSYGMYIYHVDAPELGEHVGKFAIIK